MAEDVLDLDDVDALGHQLRLPFGTISSTHHPKQIAGRAGFKISTDQTKRIKVALSPRAGATLRRRHKFRATVLTTLKLPGGKPMSIECPITVALKTH